VTVLQSVVGFIQSANKCNRARLALLLFTAILPVASAQQGSPKNAAPASSSEANRQKAAKLYSGLPLLFEHNDGQSAPEVNFLSRTPAYTLFLTGDEAVIQNTGAKDKALRMQWLGGKPNPAVTAEQPAPGKSNYFIGNNPSNWHTGVANYQRVRYSSLYPGVDLLYYGNNEKIEYDLDVAPGADPSAIRLHLTGASKLRIEKQTGDLLVTDEGGEVRFHRPDVYQGEGTERRSIAGAYVLSAQNTVSFSVGSYDHGKELVIDPSVVYATVIGGSDSTSSATGMGVDGQGFIYLQGITNAANFPTTSGAYQATCGTSIASQCSNFFVAKFDTTQSGAASLVYSTFLGGSETKVMEGDQSAYYQPNDLAVDAAGDAYFGGVSSADNYPVTSNAYSQSCVALSTDPCYGAGILTMLDPTGTKLLYSTYLPLARSVDGALTPAMTAVNSAKVAFLSGYAGPGMPATDGSSCPMCEGEPFAMAIDTTKSGTASLVYADYLPMAIVAIAADASGNAYLGGLLNNPANDVYIPGGQTLTPNGFQTTTGNTAGIGPYLVKLNASGIATYATYIGSGTGAGYGDGILGVSADASGVAYVAGQVDGPVTQKNGLDATSSYSGYGAFVAKIDTTKTGAASLLYSTYITNSDELTTVLYSVTDNGAGQVSFTGEGASETGFTETNGLTQPAPPTTAGGSLVGTLDTTKTGDAALTFLSLMDGVQFPWFVAYDPCGSLVVGGFAVTGDTSNPFLSASNSYATSVGTSNNPPFFYKIAFASNASPCISLSVPTTLPFGNQGVNTTSGAQTITIDNTGPMPIAFSGVTASGPFAETTTCSITTALAAGNSCAISVTFTPTTTGPATGTLTINDTDPSSPQAVALTGTGTAATAPAVTLDPTSLSFTTQVVGTTSAIKTVKLTNSGTASLTLTSFGLTGTNAADFILDSSACVSPLAATDSCNLSVSFAPTAAGSPAASISIVDAVGTQTVPLSGSAASATHTGNLWFNPAPVAIAVGSAQTLTASFTLTGFSSSITPTATMHYGLAYKVGAVACTGAAGDQTCTVPVTFIPNLPGGRKDALFLMNGTTRLATELAFGIGESPFALIQPGVITNPILNGPQYYYDSTVDENGTAYVVEQENNTVISVTAAGVVTALPITGLNSPRGVGIDGAGVLYIADQKSNSSITTYDTVQGIQGGVPFPTGAGSVQNVTTGNEGNLYTTNYSNVYTIAPDGTTTSTTISPGNTQANRLTVDDKEDIFVGGYDINEIPVSGPQVQVNTVGAGDGLSVDAALTLYACRYSNGGSDSVGELPASGYSAAQTELDYSANPLGCSDGPDGTLWVGNYFDLDKVDRSQGAPIAFGEQGNGTPSQPASFSIYNGGNENLILATFAVTGEGFAVQTGTTNACSAGATIAPGALCNAPIVFTGTHSGNFTGTISYSSNTLNTTATAGTVALSAYVNGIYVTVAPNPLNFGNQTVNTTSATQTVTLTNNGVNANFGGFNVLPSSVAGFNITQGTCTGKIAPGDSCSFDVTFSPTMAQAYTGTSTFTAASDASTQTQTVSFVLNGTGTPAAAPAVSLTPSSLSFSSSVNTTSAAQTVTLKNTGTAQLTNIAVSIGGTNPGDFAETTTCGTTLNAGASCPISVTFTPGSAASFAATLSVADNASDSPQTVALAGTGTGGVTASPTSVNFGNVVEYTQTSTRQYITLTNTTSSDVTLGAYTSSNPDFYAEDDTCVGGTDLPGNSTCQIYAEFLPQSVGAITGTLTIPYTGAGGGTLSVSLNGTGTAGTPAISLYPSPAIFGTLPVGTAATAVTVQLDASGTAPLTGIAISITGANASDYSETDTCTGATIDPYPGNQICNIVVNFTPSGGGPRVATLNVTSNGGAATATDALQGAGTAQVPQIQFTPTQLNLFAGAAGNCGDTTTGGAATSATLCNINNAVEDYLGNTFLVDTHYNVVYKVDTTGAISVFAGTPSTTGGYTGDGGLATSATLSGPTAVAADAFGDVYISDTANGAIRVVDALTGDINTAVTNQCDDGGRGTPEPLSKRAKRRTLGGFACLTTFQPEGLIFDGLGNLFFADPADNFVWEAGASNQSNFGSLNVVAGSSTTDGGAGTPGYTGDSGLATAATLRAPQDVAVDALGNLYIADTSNNVIRLVTASTGIITTFAGDGTSGDSGDGSAATGAKISAYGVATDLGGDVFIAAGTGGVVRKVDISGNITTFAGGGTGAIGGPTSTGAIANAYFPRADNAGDLLVPTGLQVLAAGPDGLLQFSTEPIGSTTAALTATVENTGDSNVSIESTGVNLAGTDPGDFAITGNNCGSALAPGKTCAITATFTPSASGLRTASITVGSNVAGSPQTILLQGNGTAAATPAASLSPTALSFPDTTAGSTSAALSTTLSNTGTATLNISGITLTGTNPSDFTITTSSTACGTTLAAGSTCTISVTFTPAAVASYTASISVADNASGSPQIATLSGAGTAAPAPIASLSPTSLTFPSTTAGTTSAAMFTTLSNTGNAVLNISGITLTGTNTADFTITTSSTACGTTLAAGSTCTVSATFTPAAAGSFTASISVADNATGSPQTATLSGTATVAPAPIASLSPTTLSFPSTTAGTTSAALSTTLSNTGNAVLNINGITLTGTNTGDFAITTSDTACGATLAAGATCTISVTFTPAAVATYSASISVADNAAASPQTAALSGTGLTPPATDFTLSVTPPSQTVSGGSAATFTVNATGIGGDFANAVNLTVTGLPAGFTGTFTPASITPGASGATSTLSIQTVKQLSLAGPHPLHRTPKAPWLTALLVIPLFGMRRRLKKLRLVSCMILLAATLIPTALLTGCGGGYFAVTSQTYTLTVTGTSGSIQHSTTVTLTVQQ
jgi:hypothetical protein